MEPAVEEYKKNEAEHFIDGARMTVTGLLADNLLSLPVSQVLIDPDRNLRRFAPDAKSIAKLAENIVDRASRGLRGQIQPVGVRRLQDQSSNGHTHALVFGFRRAAAIQYANENLNQPTLTLLAIEMSDADVDAMYANLDENLKRKELSYMDVAYAIGKFQEAGLTGKQIGERFGGRTTGWVSQVSKFNTLRPHIQKAIHEEKLSFGDARELPDDEAEQDRIVGDILSGKLHGRAAVRSEAAKTKKRKPQGRKEKGQAEQGSAVSLKTARAAMEELAKDATKEDPDPKEQEVVRKSRRRVFKAVMKFMDGQIGVGALGKSVERVVAVAD